MKNIYQIVYDTNWTKITNVNLITIDDIQSLKIKSVLERNGLVKTKYGFLAYTNANKYTVVTQAKIFYRNNKLKEIGL